jgi:hypothetical protein
MSSQPGAQRRPDPADSAAFKAPHQMLTVLKVNITTWVALIMLSIFIYPLVNEFYGSIYPACTYLDLMSESVHFREHFERVLAPARLTAANFDHVLLSLKIISALATLNLFMNTATMLAFYSIIPSVEYSGKYIRGLFGISAGIAIGVWLVLSQIGARAGLEPNMHDSAYILVVKFSFYIIGIAMLLRELLSLCVYRAI